MKKISLSLPTKAATTSRSKHPILSALPTDMVSLLKQFVKINPLYKDYEAQNTLLSAALSVHVKHQYFQHFAGIYPGDSGTLIARVVEKVKDSKTKKETEVESLIKLITTEKYSKKLESEAPLVAVLGKAFVDEHFHQATVLKIDVDKIPEDKQEKFATKVQKLAQDMGITEGVTYQQFIVPNTGFHQQRTILLTPEKNDEMDKVLKMVAYPQL